MPQDDSCSLPANDTLWKYFRSYCFGHFCLCLIADSDEMPGNEGKLYGE